MRKNTRVRNPFVLAFSVASSPRLNSDEIRFLFLYENSRNVREDTITRERLIAHSSKFISAEKRILLDDTLAWYPPLYDNAQRGVAGAITADYTLRDTMYSQNARRIHVADMCATQHKFVLIAN